MQKSGNAFENLEQRGFIGQVTDPGLRKLLGENKLTFYVGFDPTAASLHVGSLKQIMMMAHLQRHGHRPIAVAGGGTGMIGDPSGKSKERKLLSEEEIQANLEGIKSQLERFLQFQGGDNPALILNNADWLRDFRLLDFLREVGKFFRIGEMLGKESVRARLESEEGLSFTEFSYMLLQAYDFLYLFDHYDCVLQMGGSDQWGNITAGIELIRKLRGKTAYGLTTPLVVTASGQKFGKTEAGTVWLDPKLTSPYQFYQYFVRTDDRDVITFLKIFTFLSLEEIRELEKSLAEKPEAREAQKRLAFEVTALVHGNDAARRAEHASRILFGAEIKDLSDEDLNSIFSDVPAAEVSRERLARGMNIVDLMAECGLVKSKSEARRIIKQGGAYLNNRRVESEEKMVTLSDLASETKLVLRTGKKNYLLVSVA